MILKKEFCSKILLFGEYSVIKDSMALAVNYHTFTGHLNFRQSDSPFNQYRDMELSSFAQYMERLEDAGEINFEFDTTSFKFDVAQGLFFDSTIPQGYGVGSSGALIAALYDHYGAGNRSVAELKEIFSVMESYFHGASSGFDPLISYLDSPVLIRSKNDVTPVDIPEYKSEGQRCIFLLNTGRPRRTEPLVNLFLEKCSNEKFMNKINNELIPINNRCIEGFLKGDADQFVEGFDKLSYFQYKNFSPMIPKLYKDLWKQGLKSEEFYLKLCGAGGGGFLLGMTRDFSKTKRTLSNYEIMPLFGY
ncbi:MAG: mevalonate kinase [Bacteriovoracaceae bacterium]|nr:mevalonate kinase [Bacteriovoracaceae bacterium]